MMRACVCVCVRSVSTLVPPAPTPSLPSVIRGLLTRRVAPAPARQSFTLESNPRLSHASRRCHATPGVLLRPLLRRRILPTDRGSPKVEHHELKHASEKTRRRREPYWRRSLTTLPLLAWRPSDCTSRALCISPIYRYSRHAKPPFSLAEERGSDGGGGGGGTHAEEIATFLATFRPARSGTLAAEAQSASLSVTNVRRVSFRKDSAPGLELRKL